MLNPNRPASESCLAPTPQNLFFPPEKDDYRYFETPSYQPGERPVATLARAADASMLAYARYGQQRMVLEDLKEILGAAGYTGVRPIGDCFRDAANTGRGYFAYNDNHALLAFRGTEADNIHDQAADAKLDRAEEAPGVLVHSGFRDYLESIRNQVSQCVADYRSTHPDSNICITGHSLGGALATLAFTRLNDRASSLVTFGCPRVGNPGYCDTVTEAARTRACYRVVDNLDVVTHVPPDLLNFYAHPSITVYWLDSDHKLRVNPDSVPGDKDALVQLPDGFLTTHWFEGLRDAISLPRSLADHSPVRYAHYLGRSV